MKYTAQRLLLVALVGMLSSVTWAAQSQPLIEKVKIGVAAPLSGLQAQEGRDFLNGIILAAADFNARKPMINGKQVEIVLDTADDQADARVAVTVAEKLVNDEIKGVLGHFNSDTTMAAARIYAQAGIPQIAMATAAEYTQQGFKNTFRMMAADSQQSKIAGYLFVKKLGFKRIAILDDRTAYGKRLADRFERSVKEAGASIVKRAFIDSKAFAAKNLCQTSEVKKANPNDTLEQRASAVKILPHQRACRDSFTVLLTQFKSIKPKKAPDAIFYGGTEAQAALLVKQMSELGIKAKLIVSDRVKTSTFLQKAGTAAEGTVVSSAGMPLSQILQEQKGRKFMQQYKERFHEEVPIYAPYAYDGATAMFTAMQKANSTDPVKYLPVLAKIEMVGVTTKRFAYDKYGNLKDPKITLYQVVRGQWKALPAVIKQ